MIELIEPRNGCKIFMIQKGLAEMVLISKEEFNKKARAREFVNGPFVDSFGDGHELYNPNRQAFGIGKDGKAYYCELNPTTKSEEEK